MATRHREMTSATAVGGLMLWAVLAVPAWADAGIDSADGGIVTVQTSAQSRETAAGYRQIRSQDASVAKRDIVADHRVGGIVGMSLENTLLPFAGNEVLGDASLFGIGLAPGGDPLPWVSAGRVGQSYSHPESNVRFQHNVFLTKGLQMAFGSFAPTRLTSLASSEAGGALDEGAASHFESELSYSSAFSGGNFRTWLDTLWQDASPTCIGLAATAAACGDSNRRGWGVGSALGYMGFELVGYFHNSNSLGVSSRFTHNALWTNTSGTVAGRKTEGYFVQGSYALNRKTRVGLSYSEGSMETSGRRAVAANLADQQLERQLWTVGVYHDVSSWLRLMAEYNRGELNAQTIRKDTSANAISVGTFMYW